MLTSLIINFLIALVFSMVIFLFTDKKDWNVNKDLSFFDCVYTTLSSLSTVGYGDILPVSNKSKIIITCLQAIVLIEIMSMINHLMNNELSLYFFYKIIKVYTIVILFTLVFMFAAKNTDFRFPQDSDTNNFVNMFYFTHTSITTCGYGDIVPASTKTKILCMIIESLIILQALSI